MNINCPITEFSCALLAVLVAVVAYATPAQAYIGPGAGFALLSSFLVVFTTIILALFTVLLYPFRTLWRALRRRKTPKARIKRMIVVGLDGQEPKITDRLLKEGKLPNFERLAKAGCYSRLRTTFPSVSPVAWSSFSTGTSPAKHNIFDFLDRDLRTYLPLLSSTRMLPTVCEKNRWKKARSSWRASAEPVPAATETHLPIAAIPL